jgi:hypothetical protein
MYRGLQADGEKIKLLSNRGGVGLYRLNKPSTFNWQGTRLILGSKYLPDHWPSRCRQETPNTERLILCGLDHWPLLQASTMLMTLRRDFSKSLEILKMVSTHPISKKAAMPRAAPETAPKSEDSSYATI